MKQFGSLVVAAIFAVAISTVEGQTVNPALLAKLQANTAACNASEHPPASDVTLYLNHQLPKTKAGNCFVGCMQEKMGWLVNGAFSQAASDKIAKANLANKPEILAKVLEIHAKCAAEVGTSTDKCVTGPKLMACVQKYRKQ